MIALNKEMEEWLQRFQAGKEYAGKMIPGLALLWKEYTRKGETTSI